MGLQPLDPFPVWPRDNIAEWSTDAEHRPLLRLNWNMPITKGINRQLLNQIIEHMLQKRERYKVPSHIRTLG
jgi:hypothetical protein